MAEHKQVLCPSAQPDWEGSMVIGVVGGTVDQPEMAYLKNPQAVTDDILKLAGPVNPAEVFRFAAPCACSGCGHFAAEEAQCRLVQKVVRWVPMAVDKLPECSIRPSCRWWQQEGRAACQRCPSVVTNNYQPSEEMRQAADPMTA